jgi:hypothetical protein
LADKLSHLLLDALARAALAPGGSPLVGAKAAPGLFPATAPARQAAQRACADGLIRLVTADPTGKPDRGLYGATDAGLAFLLRHTSPKQVLEDLARAIESRHGQVESMLGLARETQSELIAMKGILSQVRPKLSEPAAADWLIDLRQHLSDWDTGGAAGDCPLPDLFGRLRAAHSALTIGRFHDGLRELHDREQLYLHPWTGPLYALPEPAFALLVGHEIAYYASLRTRSQESGIRNQPASAAGQQCSDLLPALA